MSRLAAAAGLILCLTFLSTTGAIAQEDLSPGIESSVVKVYARSNAPSLLSPWQKRGVDAATGSGVIIAGNRILTNAHVVDDYVSLEVKRAGMTRRFPAEVEYFGHECDLALLLVTDPRFFEGAEPLPLGRLPHAQASVEVYGFPVGGETISVTSGIVSRVEVSRYAHSLESLLLAQIDAAINPGNSGGPVVVDGTLVGLAVQSLDDAENVGYMIPAPVIEHFLEDILDDRYDGFPDLGIDMQPLESDAQRAYLGMGEDETGALVTRIAYDSPGWEVLKPGDVLLSLDGTPVANDLTVEWPVIGRVDFTHLLHTRQAGTPVSLTVLREGKRRHKVVELRNIERLVPGRRARPTPTHLVFGGLVFRPLTREYLNLWEDPPFDLATLATKQNIKTPERQQVILMSQVLPSVVNRGYQEIEDIVLETVNGVTPRDMVHLARLLDATDDEWVTFTADDGSTLTLNVAEARSEEPRILAGYGLAKDRSADLLPATESVQQAAWVVGESAVATAGH